MNHHEDAPTPESTLNRRELLQTAAVGGILAAASTAGCGPPQAPAAGEIEQAGPLHGVPILLKD